MPRKPRKVKPGSGVVRVNVLVDSELLARVDDEAARMTEEDPYKRATSRSDALRSLIDDGLKFRGEQRNKR